MLRKSDSVEECRTFALGIKLETNWKPNFGSALERNLALVVNQLINRSSLSLLPNEQCTRAVLALPFEM